MLTRDMLYRCYGAWMENLKLAQRAFEQLPLPLYPELPK